MIPNPPTLYLTKEAKVFPGEDPSEASMISSSFSSNMAPFKNLKTKPNHKLQVCTSLSGNAAVCESPCCFPTQVMRHIAEHMWHALQTSTGGCRILPLYLCLANTIVQEQEQDFMLRSEKQTELVLSYETTTSHNQCPRRTRGETDLFCFFYFFGGAGAPQGVSEPCESGTNAVECSACKVF